jgi:hypothetical protein
MKKDACFVAEYESTPHLKLRGAGRKVLGESGRRWNQATMPRL